MGNHLYLSVDSEHGASWPLTIETVADAATERWPSLKLYRDGPDDDRQLGFWAPMEGTEVDFTFFEKLQFVTVDLDEPGAAVCEWFMRLVPENVPCVVFEEQFTEAVPVPPHASARQLLDAARWPKTR